MNSGIFRYRRS